MALPTWWKCRMSSHFVLNMFFFIPEFSDVKGTKKALNWWLVEGVKMKCCDDRMENWGGRVLSELGTQWQCGMWGVRGGITTDLLFVRPLVTLSSQTIPGRVWAAIQGTCGGTMRGRWEIGPIKGFRSRGRNERRGKGYKRRITQLEHEKDCMRMQRTVLIVCVCLRREYIHIFCTIIQKSSGVRWPCSMDTSSICCLAQWDVFEQQLAQMCISLIWWRGAKS